MHDEPLIAELKAAKAQYEEAVRTILDKVPGAMKEYATVSGLPVDPLYTPDELEGTDFHRDISFPGAYPYTRGVFAAGYRTRFGNSRQVTGLGTAEETNQRWKYLISHGATALAVVYNYVGGYDADDPRAEGFAGKDGVVLNTLPDYEDLFDGIDLG